MCAPRQTATPHGPTPPAGHAACSPTRPRVRPPSALCPLPPRRLIDAEVLPVLKQSSLAGAAEYRSQARLLAQHPHAVDILIDVLSDRGFRCAWRASREHSAVPGCLRSWQRASKLAPRAGLARASLSSSPARAPHRA